MANAPVAPPAPAAPADAGTPAAAPKSLSDIRNGMTAVRGKPVQGPQGGFVKMPGGPAKAAPVAPKLDAPAPSTAAKAGAPADVKPATPEPKAEAPAAPAEPPAAKDPTGELKRAFDAKSRELAALQKQMMEYENLGKTDFQTLVRKLAEHYKADPEAIAEKLLLQRATKWEEEQRLAQMSPEQREYYELKRDAEARKVSDAKAAEEAKVQATKAQEAATYEATTGKLIEAHKLLPESIRNNPQFNGRAALRLKDALLHKALAADPEMPTEQFLAGVDTKALAAEAWAEYRAELREAALALDDAGLDELFDAKLQERFTARLRTAAQKRAHPSLTAQPRTGTGQFAPGTAKPEAKPLSAMKPAWGNFVPKPRR